MLKLTLAVLQITIQDEYKFCFISISLKRTQKMKRTGNYEGNVKFLFKYAAEN